MGSGGVLRIESGFTGVPPVLLLSRRLSESLSAERFDTLSERLSARLSASGSRYTPDADESTNTSLTAPVSNFTKIACPLT